MYVRMFACMYVLYIVCSMYVYMYSLLAQYIGRRSYSSQENWLLEGERNDFV